MSKPIRIKRAIDPAKFIPIDFATAFGRRYKDKATGETKSYRHTRAITARNIAKSYQATVLGTEAALKGMANGDDSHKFMYLRRGDNELEASFPTLFKDVEQEFPDFAFRCKGDRWEAKPWEAPASSWKAICYGRSLSVGYKVRSTVFVDVDFLWMDEFVDDGSLVIAKEVTKWDSLYDTVARNRFVRSLFTANPQFLTPGVMNPYFVADGITVTAKMPEWINLRKSSTQYWFPPAGKYGNQEETDRMREISGTDYAKMSLGGEFVHAYGIPIGARGQYAEPLCGLLMHGDWYSLWTDKEGLFAERGAPKTDMPRYAMSPQDIKVGVRLAAWSDPLLAAVRDQWRSGAIIFKDTAVHAALQEIMVR